MKKKTVLFFFGLFFLFSQVCLAEAPKAIAGISLSGNIGDYTDRILEKSALPIRYQKYLTEVELKPPEGYKSGLLTYGSCSDPGRIVRIKLKYADSSRSFYDQLLKRFKKRFGEPDEWRGDPFHVVMAWKWSFRDRDGNPLSMILQHNTLDEEEKRGNAVKINMTGLILKEQLCFEKKHAEKPNPRKTEPGRIDWERLVPR